MEKILIAQFIAHLLADYFAQPQCVSDKKRSDFLSSWHIYVHAVIVFAASAAATLTWEFALWAGAIALVHFGIDVGKVALELRMKARDESFRGGRLLFFADQFLHFAVIYLAVLLYVRSGGQVPGYLEWCTVHGLLVTAGLLLCLKPANILVKVCLSTLKTNSAIGESLQNESLQRAGRWIGSIERAITFVLVVMGHYTAMGFIIAAKSILRYGDNTHKTEYVLVGTLISFGLAFALGTGVASGFFDAAVGIISCN